MNGIKRLLAVLLGMAMIFSLTGCGLEQPLQTDPTGTGSQQAPQTQPQQDQKVEDSKTLALFRQVLAGDYTWTIATFEKTLDGTQSETVTSRRTQSRMGDRIYKEYVSSSGLTLQRIIQGDTVWELDPASKTAMKGPYYASRDQELSTFGTQESDYYDLSGQPGTQEIFGKTYYSEHFSFPGVEGVDYCYDGDTLRYILSTNGGVTYLMEVELLEVGAREECFQIPEDYTRYGE